MSNVRYNGDPRRGLSPVIWGDLSKIRYDQDMGDCAFIFDDFLCVTNHASAQASGGYFTYQDSGVTISGKGVNDLSKEVGVMRIAGNDADDDEGNVQFGHGNQFRIGNSNGNTGKVMFECRLNVADITNNAVSVAVGLVEGPVATVHVDDNTGEIKDGLSFIGFRSLNDDGDKMDIVYQDTGASSVVTVLANAVTLVANTYSKLGFLFDNSNITKKIRFYVNSVEVASVNTTQIDTSTFPEDEGMAPVIMTKSFGGAETIVDVDWVAACQYATDVE